MAWIESHQSLEKHGKLIELARLLSITRYEAIGHLHCLWWWCIDSAPTGELSKYDPYTIAEAAGWIDYENWALNNARDFKHISAGRFVAALISTGWIDAENDANIDVDHPIERCAKIHDWLDFCGDLVKKRIEKRDEKRSKSTYFAKIINNQVATSKSGRKSPPTVPYRTLPYHKEEIRTPHTPQGEDLFESFWKAYPKKVAKGAAQKALAKHKPTQELVQRMLTALDTQARTEQWTKDDGKFIPHPATWLNQRRWEDEIPPPKQTNGFASVVQGKYDHLDG